MSKYILYKYLISNEEIRTGMNITALILDI